MLTYSTQLLSRDLLCVNICEFIRLYDVDSLDKITQHIFVGVCFKLKTYIRRLYNIGWCLIFMLQTKLGGLETSVSFRVLSSIWPTTKYCISYSITDTVLPLFYQLFIENNRLILYTFSAKVFLYAEMYSINSPLNATNSLINE